MDPRADHDELPVPGAMPTPGSLSEQRVEPPTLDQQLTDYERRQALLSEQEDLDPHTAQGVYLLVSVVIGVLLAAVLAGGLTFAGWLLQVF